MAANIAQIHQQLDATCKQHDYAGWDPFDALNSRLFQLTPLAWSKWTRLAWLQFFKRSPVNFRPLTLTPRSLNAKALALFTRSYLLAGNTERAEYCLNKMMQLRTSSESWGKAAWGYPFDWQAKAFFVSTETPNVICTTYAILAIEAAAEAGLIDPADELIIAAADFVLEHLLCDNEQGFYIAYVPGGSNTLVHNASLWGAYLCTRAYAVSGKEHYRDVAQKVIATSVQAQQPDGHWRYGTMSHHQFIDGFHTGYNLEALYRSNQILEDQELTHTIASGLNYYIEHFFNEDGQAAYYHNNPYPLDPHSFAQGILTLQLIDSEKHEALYQKIAEYACTHLWDEVNHSFHYQQNQNYTNKICYLRWTQAWMHLALSALKQR